MQVPHGAELRKRISQTRKDLIRLQNLHYKVRYQLGQVHSMERLYRLMLRQKQRLTAIPAAQNARVLQQELKLQRYLLLEEQVVSESPSQQQAISDALDEIEQQIYLCRELVQLEAELQTQQQQMLLLLEQRQLWMVTAPALGLAGITSLIQNLVEQTPVILKLIWKKLTIDWWLVVILIPAFMVSQWLGRANQYWLSKITKPAELTAHNWLKLACGLIFRQAPLFLLLLLLAHLASGAEGGSSLLYGLLLLTFGWCVLLDVTRKAGFVEKCLSSDSLKNPWSAHLAIPSLLALWIAGLSLQWYDNPFDNRIGQLLLFVCSCSQLAIFWYHDKNLHTLDWPRQCIRFGCIFILALTTISAALGYVQLAWLFFSHLQAVFLMGSFLWIIYLFSAQALRVRTTSLAKQQAVQLKKETVAAISSKEALKNSRQAINELESQGRKILSLFFILITALLFILIWNSISPLLSPLTEARLLSFSDEKTALSIALGAVVGFLLTIMVTFFTAHNMSGLLHILLSDRMMRQPGNIYILNRILVYLIWAVGCTVALGQIGLPWDKVQWIILAVSVGAGLGLQEIVANFISGLIILIERPIRVGDTITINEVEGIVRQITVRATIIEIVDLREFIVPNKALITGQLTNWSLSSSILRIQLWYGVSHGSDNDLVLMLLLRAAEDCSMVLRKPQSIAAFIECTEHCDRYELRIFVDVDDRFLVRNQVNRQVRTLFREHGIKIAHLQHSLYVEKRKPEANDNSGDH